MEQENHRKGRFLTIENVKGMIVFAAGAAIWIAVFIGILQGLPQ